MVEKAVPDAMVVEKPGGAVAQLNRHAAEHCRGGDE